MSITGRAANFLSIRMPGLSKAASRDHARRFTKSGGRSFATFLGKPVFRLTVAGRVSGESRDVMLMLVRRGDDLVVCGSFGGNPKTPSWYLNLAAAGRATVQVGPDEYSVTFREVTGAERNECWALAIDSYPDFGVYAELTDRVIPVGVLVRAAT